MQITKLGKYKTRVGQIAEIFRFWGNTLDTPCYAEGYINLKTKRQQQTWNVATGYKVCYSNYGKNAQDLIAEVPPCRE